jgi:hypothetical protein
MGNRLVTGNATVIASAFHRTNAEFGETLDAERIGLKATVEPKDHLAGNATFGQAARSPF